MKKSKFTEGQIVKALQSNENGKSVEQISRELKISTGTFYSWRKKYGGLEINQLKRLTMVR